MKKNNSILLSGPYILWMVIFTLIPLGVVAYYAFTDPTTGAFSMKNILELQNYLPVLWQSILYSLISAFICLLLGYPVALILTGRDFKRPALWLMLLIPRRNFPGWEKLSAFHYAHRGLHSESIPENSLAAFRNAREKGYGVELDVQPSSDGVAMVFHDKDLERMCGVKGAPCQF